MHLPVGCGPVAQIFNLLYRRFVIGRALDTCGRIQPARTLQNAILRYSRLKICATTSDRPHAGPMNRPSQVFRFREVPRKTSWLLDARGPLRVTAVALIVCALFLWLPAFGSELAPVPRTIIVRSCGNTSPTLAYAVQRIVAELRAVHGLQAGGEEAAADPFQSTAEHAGVVILGRPSESAPLAKWCRDRGLDLSGLASPPDGYRIVAQSKPWRIVIVADSDAGAWYGACAWMDSLRDTADGAVSTPLGEAQDAPALAIRFYAGAGLGRTSVSARGCDSLARLVGALAHECDARGPAFRACPPGVPRRGAQPRHTCRPRSGRAKPLRRR